MKKIILIDGHSILTRAFYGVPLLTNHDGIPTNAVYGFLNIMFKAIEEEKTDSVIVAFDLKEPTFRHKKYSEYKGTRKPMPEELHAQVPVIKDVLSAMKIPVVTKCGYEADDILGTLSKRFQKDGYDVALISGDRDLLQLADDKIKICIPKTSKGVTTTSYYYPDDVKNEYGVSPKEFIDVKALMGDTSDNIPGLPGVGEKTATSIIAQFGSIENAHEHAAEVKPPRASKALIDNYDSAVMSKWLATIDTNAPIDDINISDSDIFNSDAYEICRKLELNNILKKFSGVPDNVEIIDESENRIINDGDYTYVSDLKPLYKSGELTYSDKLYDIGIVQYLLNPLNKPSNYFTLDKAKEYLARLETDGMMRLYKDIELPLIKSLADMELAGVKVDSTALKEYADELKIQLDRIESEIYADAGETFNINSPKQLGVILFEKIGLPSGKKTKTGYSTSADVLDKLAADYPVVRKILDYRTFAKLYSTYAVGLADYISGDGRIHGNFNQTITATGRISSTEPNLQNIPIRTELGSRLRDVFIPEDGYVFVDADYSQIELRVLAAMSGDEELINAYRNAADIHTITASQVFHVPVEEVTPQLRRNAKAVNFGVVYGISAFGLSEGLSITRREAQEYINNYFITYPKVKEYLDGQIRFAKENGYVTTLFGRRRPIPELISANFMQRQFGERVAMNSPIQGTAADIMKIAMNRVHDQLLAENLDARIVLQIHDELLIEVKAEQAEYVKELVVNTMSNAADIGVSLEVDAHIGSSWLKAK